MTYYWSYAEQDVNNPSRSLYQNVVFGDLILILGMVFGNSVKLKEIRSFFKETLQSHDKSNYFTRKN